MHFKRTLESKVSTILQEINRETGSIFYYLFIYLITIAAGLSTEEGPWFTSEPSSWLEFTNQTGGSVSCSAGGHPAPQVVWMTAGNDAALIATGPGLMTTTSEVSGLRRVVVSSRSGESGDSLIYNNASLIFMPFSATAYRPDVHSTTYRCRATNSAGTILSREMKLKTGKQYRLS